MGFYIKKNNLYASIGKDKSVFFVSEPENAYCFESKESAEKAIRRCRQKLKGGSIAEIDKKKENGIVLSKRRKFTSDERKIVYAKTKGCCALCGQFMYFDEFTVDHILPISKGGTNNMDNLQATCLVCNRIKQDILPQDFMDKIAEVFLHNMKTQYRYDIMGKLVKIHKMRSRKFLIDLIKNI